MDKHQFFQAAQPKTKVVEIPEWGADGEPMRLTIRELTAAQITTIMEQINAGHSGSACQIIGSVINGDGQLMFTADDEAAILSMSGSGTARLNIAINELNGFVDTKKN